MKLDYKNLKKKSSLLKSATGLSLKEFDFLKPPFEKSWLNYINRYTFEGKKRQRTRAVRADNTFPCIEDMMIFILYDYRHNPTQEFMGLHFDLPQPKVAMWIKVLEPVLEKSLKQMGLVPTRESDSLNERLVNSVTILLDGSERVVNHPKYDQEEFYSGKKRNTQ
ncbi:MAG: transposase family protein [Bacteroidota bacterium]|nr:transposase family protein [Bacteroidota bacterium]